MSGEPNDAKVDKKSWAAGASVAGAVGAALAGAACCVGPLVVAALGLGGAGAMVALAPYRPFFLIATAAMLAIGFFLVYRRRPAPAAGGDECGCDGPAPQRKRDVAKIMLWVATVVVVGFTVSPYVIGAVADASDEGRAARTGGGHLRRVRLRVVGMDCASCAVGIQRAMDRVGPYRDFQLDLEGGTISFVYDGDEELARRFAHAIRDLGYEVGEPTFL